MKKFVKSILLVVLAAVMVVSSLIVVSAVETAAADNGEVVITSGDGGQPVREYELVWKFKEEGGHLYRRRWNATLGIWYDPAWILVY